MQIHKFISVPRIHPNTFVLALILVLSSALTGFCQQCPLDNDKGPSIPSESRTLEGQLIYHDGIRQWYELKLDQSQCGQSSIELVRTDPDWTPLEVLRGCRVHAQGPIGISGTGYYSLDMYQDVMKIQASGDCVRQLPFPDYSKARPDKKIRSYRVNMDIDYIKGDHPIRVRITHAGKELRPWQAYASYSLTGGYVLYGNCAKGFVVNTVIGTPQASPEFIDNAMFDPESAAAKGITHLHMGYTCVRHR